MPTLEGVYKYRNIADAIMFAEGALYRIVATEDDLVAYHPGDSPGMEWYLEDDGEQFVWTRH